METPALLHELPDQHIELYWQQHSIFEQFPKLPVEMRCKISIHDQQA
jgi:hypothetical protein